MEQRAEPNRIGGKEKILVVDDEPAIRRIIALNLKADGYEVMEAADGVVALEDMRSWHPDLVLLDVMMPRMDGFEVIRQVKANSALASIPVVILTARGREPDVLRGLRQGAADYVPKPFSPSELALRIRRILDQAASQQKKAG